MNPGVTCCPVNWKWSLPGLIVVALLSAFFNPPDPGVTSGEFEYVQRVVVGITLFVIARIVPKMLKRHRDCHCSLVGSTWEP
jgi:hypothetical protein